MRAREFIREQKELSPEQAGPMRYAYVLPGLSASDPYKNYRMGVAVARARSDYATELNPQNDGIDPYKPEWSRETPFGEHAVVVGTTQTIEKVIDRALQMTGTPGGKKLVSSPDSEDPLDTNVKSPLNGFKGYPR